MSDRITSQYPDYGINSPGNSGRAQSLYQFGVAQQSASQSDGIMAPSLSVLPIEETPPVPDTSVAELTIRRLSKEIELARVELRELEDHFVHEMLTPTVRQWLFPLLAIGLALSLYGSFSASDTAEMGATGLMLLWSLSAFWFMYTRDRRMEMTKNASKAEIEIWSHRIEELERSLEHNQRVMEVAAK